MLVTEEGTQLWGRRARVLRLSQDTPRDKLFFSHLADVI